MKKGRTEFAYQVPLIHYKIEEIVSGAESHCTAGADVVVVGLALVSSLSLLSLVFPAAGVAINGAKARDSDALKPILRLFQRVLWLFDAFLS